MIARIKWEQSSFRARWEVILATFRGSREDATRMIMDRTWQFIHQIMGFDLGYLAPFVHDAQIIKDRARASMALIAVPIRIAD